MTDYITITIMNLDTLKIRVANRSIGNGYPALANQLLKPTGCMKTCPAKGAERITKEFLGRTESTEPTNPDFMALLHAAFGDLEKATYTPGQRPITPPLCDLTKHARYAAFQLLDNALRAQTSV